MRSCSRQADPGVPRNRRRPEVVYPFHGGMFDRIGVMFTLEDGTFVDLFSFGRTPEGLLYGMKLIRPLPGGGYRVLPPRPPDGPMRCATVTVAEPASLGLFGAMAFGFFAWWRSTEARKRTVASFA